MQGLAIYILIRLDEGEREHNDFDLLLIRTVTVGFALSSAYLSLLQCHYVGTFQENALRRHDRQLTFYAVQQWSQYKLERLDF